MVVSAASKEKQDEKAFVNVMDVEAQDGNKKEMVSLQVSAATLRSNRKNSRRFCIALPWTLFAICFLLLGASMRWGWEQHLKLQDSLKREQAILNAASDVEADLLSQRKIPYGNDGLMYDAPESEETDVVIQEEVINVGNKPEPATESEDPPQTGHTWIYVFIQPLQDMIDNVFSNVGDTGSNSPTMQPQAFGDNEVTGDNIAAFISPTPVP